ncbi:MAG: hypothetical protein M1835_006371 [Candelina submexicana]|nr:MAG: hypothetical protein M1835_006371 [Candelina submexicana]
MPTPTTLNTAISELLTAYNDLNNSSLDILTSEPSPLEFMRYVSKNRPFVIRGGASNWPATKKWNAEYLVRAMGGNKIQVAITPCGNADSLVCINASNGGNNNGEELRFVKPLEVEEEFSGFLEYVQRQELQRDYCERTEGGEAGEVKYAQTQNDNLRNEYLPLFADVERDIAWARIALAKAPDAVNLWIGNSRSVTSLHKDNYENVYVQVVGRKCFVLLPPVEAVCVEEKEMRAATYVRDREGKLVVRDDEGGEMVPTATWDPDVPAVMAKGLERMSRPLRVTLDEGDMLYLPALW